MSFVVKGKNKWLTLETSVYSLQWPIYIINVYPGDKTNYIMKGVVLLELLLSLIASKASLLNDFYIKNLAFYHTATFIHR